MFTVKAEIKTPEGITRESHCVPTGYSPEQRKRNGEKLDEWKAEIKSRFPDSEIKYSIYCD